MPDIKDITPVDDTSAMGTMALYQKQQMERQEELDLAMLGFAVIAIVQMVLYYDKAKDAIKDRNCVIGKYESSDMGMLGFLAELESYRDYDYSILVDKRENALDNASTMLNKWSPNYCDDAMRYTDEFIGDAKSIKDFEEMFAEYSHDGIPDGWGTHDGSLARGLGAAFAGPMMQVASKDLYEELKGKVLDLVLKAQSASKAIYNISSIMGYYTQAYQIYQGLSDLYISGFNSGAAMLGTSLGNLYKPGVSTNAGGTTVRVGGANAPTGSTPISIGWSL